jgi:hypothetical protein
MAGGGERERERWGHIRCMRIFLLIKNDIREKTIMPLTK